MQYLERDEVVALAVRQLNKPCLRLVIDKEDNPTRSEVIANAPYLAQEKANFFFQDELFIACDSLDEGLSLLAQTVLDNVRGGVYACFYDAHGGVVDENT